MTAIADAAPRVRDPDLKRRLLRAERRQVRQSVLLVAPLFLFILISFALPIVTLLTRAVSNPEVGTNLPRTMAALAGWDGAAVPGEPVFAALAEDLKETQKARTTALIGKRMNYDWPGARTIVVATGKAVQKVEAGPWKPVFVATDPVWDKVEWWAALDRAGAKYTDFYLLGALDHKRDAAGNIVPVEPDQAVFIDIFARTILIALLVTLATLVLGFPVAYLLATLPARTANLLMILVLLPFWTSLLVRTTAWVVLLQTNGMVNDVLIWLHVISEPVQLIFNRGGTIVAMTHIQLPFTLLPIYALMRTISPSHVRAARSLGAGPFEAFWRVYAPQTLPGVGAGCLLTFILSLGYYITPALVGGATDQMISYFVAFYTNKEINWGLASALGLILLSLTLGLYLLYNKLVGVDNMKLG
jgi:putative spermidine/putrescine transport system permease protein